MNTKKGVQFLLLFGMLFILACESTTTSTGVEGAYAKCYGDETQMVTAAFAEFAPVSSETSPYQPGEEIDVEIVLQNQFSEDIDAGNAKVRLTGDAAVENIFSGADVETADTLFGIDAETCLIEDTEVEIGPLVYEGEITTKISKEVTGLYCYEQPVIVKGFLYFTDDATEIGTTLPSGSNPPSSLQVTQIEQNPVDIDESSDTGEMRFKIYVKNLGTGTIVPSLDQCFEYRDIGYREEFNVAVEGAYTIECPDDVRLSRDEKTDVITCKVSNIDATNIGPSASEITITFSDFAYEDIIPPTTIWLEP